MLSGKFLITLMGIFLAIFAICKLDFGGQPIVENWWGAGNPGFTTRAMPGARLSNGQEVAIGGNYINPGNMMGSGKFVSTPSFQAVLAPRFSNVQYGANIRYNMPDRENMAVPCEPLTFGDMATKEGWRTDGSPSGGGISPAMRAQQMQMNNNSRPARENYSQPPSQPPSQENYCGSCGTSDSAPSCGKGGYGFGHRVAGGYELPSGYANGNYWDEINKIVPDGINGGSDLPIGTMSTMDGAGNVDQFIAFNRIMVANTKGSSRLRAQGDPIRGDLAIVPRQSGWFSVYPDISRDLQEGAMNVLAGAGGGGSSYNDLMKLIVTASGGSQTALGGVDLSESLPTYNANMAGESVTSLRAAMGDVNVTSFP